MKKILKDKYFKLFLLIILLSVLWHGGFRKFKIEGQSMSFTYGNGQVVLVDKARYKMIDPDRGDVIAFYNFDEGDFMVKRVIGLPGEEVSLVKGDIYLDGTKHSDKFTGEKPSLKLVGPDNEELLDWETGEPVYELETRSPYLLKEGEYWVIGDNRKSSWYGIVHKSEIIGKVK